MAISKVTVVKIILGLVAIAGVLFLLFVVAVFVFVGGIGHEHGKELNQLRSDTSVLLSSLDQSKVAVTNQDCHDVELQNQCFVTLKASVSGDEEKAYVTSYLEQHGFSLDPSEATEQTFHLPGGKKEARLVVYYNAHSIVTNHESN